jgi:hypothetical protein
MGPYAEDGEAHKSDATTKFGEDGKEGFSHAITR